MRICVLWTPEALFQLFYKFLTLSAWYYWSTISAGCTSQEVFNAYYVLCRTKVLGLFVWAELILQGHQSLDLNIVEDDW